jgi:hypothetical protein
MTFSEHAARRAQQQGISDDAIDAAIAYGRMERQLDGRRAFYLDRRSVEMASRRGVRLDRYRNVLVVVARDETVVTTGRYPHLRCVRRLRKQ